MKSDQKRERLEQLSRDLRAALSNGCPAWLVDAAHQCVTDLDRLAMFDAPEAEVRAAALQAETLIDVCRASSSKTTLAG